MRIELLLIFSLVCSYLSAQDNSNSWYNYRGNADLTGQSQFEITSNPVLLWSFASGEKTKSSPVISDGVIYFGGEKGALIAVNSDGKLKWKFYAGTPLDAPPLIYANYIIVGGFDGILRSFDKSSGKLSWSYKTDNQIVGSANIWISGNKSGIIVGSYDYFLHSVDPANGKLLWKVETENYLNGTPAVAGNRIIFGGCDGIIRISEPLSGKEKDTVDIGVYIPASPSVSGQKAFFGDYDGTFYCLNLVNRKIAWKIPPGDQTGAILGIPAVSDNAVIFGNEDKYLYCYNLDGILSWKFRTNGRITGSAVVSSQKVIFGSMDGYIYILDLKSGKKLWSFNTGSPISSSPAVINNRFYILAEDGRLLSFGLK